MATPIERDWGRIIGNIARNQKTDLTIKCGGNEHRVHKIIMTSVSTFFDKACNGPFKEAQSNIIELPDDDPAVIEALINYLYTEAYSDIFENLKTSWHGWTYLHDELDPPGWEGKDDEYEHHTIPFHLEVYTLADKFDIPGLQTTAENEVALLVADLGAYWDEDTMGQIIDMVHCRGEGMKQVVDALAKAIVISQEPHIRLRSDGHGSLQAFCRWPELCYHILKRLK